MSTADTLVDHLIVDGIEGHLARVEYPDGHTEDMPLARLPRGVREGDLVIVTVTGGDVEFRVDAAATEVRRGEARARLNALNTVPDGEINL